MIILTQSNTECFMFTLIFPINFKNNRILGVSIGWCRPSWRLWWASHSTFSLLRPCTHGYHSKISYLCTNDTLLPASYWSYSPLHLSLTSPPSVVIVCLLFHSSINCLCIDCTLHKAGKFYSQTFFSAEA